MNDRGVTELQALSLCIYSNLFATIPTPLILSLSGSCWLQQDPPPPPSSLWNQWCVLLDHSSGLSVTEATAGSPNINLNPLWRHDFQRIQSASGEAKRHIPALSFMCICCLKGIFLQKAYDLMNWNKLIIILYWLGNLPHLRFKHRSHGKDRITESKPAQLSPSWATQKLVAFNGTIKCLKDTVTRAN